MRRREFVAGLGVAVSWPFAARAQQPAIPVIGFLRSASAATSMHMVAAFRKGLADAGFVDGKDVAIELRFADDDLGRLPAMAADLVRRGAAVIVGNNFAIPAIKAATTTIPILFIGGVDPVRAGFVKSFNNPGVNVTGITSFAGGLTAKRLQLLHDLAPKSGAIAVLLDPNAAEMIAPEERDAMEAARALGRDILVTRASTPPELAAAFATIARARPAGLLVGGGAFLSNSQREQLVAFAARQSLIAIYQQRETVEAGGLMSYGTSQTDTYRQAGVYAARILKGEKPADLPVLQPTKFELVINLKTAKALGLAIPPGVLAIADEVIE